MLNAFWNLPQWVTCTWACQIQIQTLNVYWWKFELAQTWTWAMSPHSQQHNEALAKSWVGNKVDEGVLVIIVSRKKPGMEAAVVYGQTNGNSPSPSESSLFGINLALGSPLTVEIGSFYSSNTPSPRLNADIPAWTPGRVSTTTNGDSTIIKRRVTLNKDDIKCEQGDEMTSSQKYQQNLEEQRQRSETMWHGQILEQRLKRLAVWNTGFEETSVTSCEMDIVGAQQSPGDTDSTRFATLAASANHNRTVVKCRMTQ